MNNKKVYEDNKTYERQKDIKKSFRIVASTTAVVILVLLLVLYTLGVGILRDNVKRETLSEMNVAEDNIFRSSTSVREFVKYLYLKGAFKSIIFDENENMEEISLAVNKAFNEISIVMPYIHSVQFYNGRTDKMYYTGLGSIVDLEQEKEDIKELREHANSFDSVLRRLNMHMGNSQVSKNVISYVLYSEIDNNSFIVFNIDISWIYDCINTNTYSDINLLLDVNGAIIGKDVFSEDDGKICDVVRENKAAFLNDFYSTVKRIDGKKHLVICKKLKNLDITVYRAYPLSEIYSVINRFRLYIIVIGGIFELIMLMLSMFLNKKIYLPVMEFVSMVQSQIGGNDELANAKDIMRRYKYQSEIETQESELWQAVSGNPKADGEQIKKTLKKYGIDLAESNIVAAVLEIEDYHRLCIEASRKEVNALIYGVYNIAMEIVCQKFSCVGINGVDGNIILLITVSGSREEVYGELRGCFNEISEIIFSNLAMSVSAYVSDCIGRVENIPPAIENLMKNKIYKYNYGSRCCIMEYMIKENLENSQKSISAASLERLREDIINRNADDIDAAVEIIIDETRRMDYYTELAQLFYVVNETVELFGKISSKSLIEVKSLSREILECDSIIAAKSILSGKIKKAVMEVLIDDKMKSENSTKNIAALVKDIIENEYGDIDLCADYIADRLGTNARKLSSVFKDTYNISIVEYISKVRLEKSIEILSRKKVSVKDVVSMVGFSNEAYFYRVFKKNYGTTPLKYIELNNDSQNEREGFKDGH